MQHKENASMEPYRKRSKGTQQGTNTLSKESKIIRRQRGIFEGSPKRKAKRKMETQKEGKG